MPSQGVPGAPPLLPELPDPVEKSVLPTLTGVSAPTYTPPALPPVRYQLGREIARGGMGRVVDATDTRLGRSVAYKEALTGDSDTLRRFEREIRITARLEHPSIVPVHDAGETSSGAPFYVMRKVSGRPLERLVASADTLGQRLALIPHIVDAAQAIAHAHERGVVHRDIKPSNILIGELGETVVIDWGLAKAIGEPDEAHAARPLVDLTDALKTRAGIVYGTPGFMAPEQLRGAPVDERCDVYALGATLYHLLSRTPPHHAQTADEMMKAAVAAPPTPVHDLVAGVPPDLSTIVDKALAHDPRVRYQNARALAEDLHRFLTGQLVASHHYSRREKLIRWVRKNRGVAAAVAALIVVGSVAMVRIVVERNRADRAARVAVAERAEAERRAEELTLSQARYDVDVNPTRAITMLRPLAARYWREVRALAAAARAAGVAWSLPAARQTRSLVMSRDGARALSAGADGVVRIHDLARRTTRPILELGAPVMARFGDADRKVVVWRDARLIVLDPATGQRRELTAPTEIFDLEVVGETAYWVDVRHALWQLALSGSAPQPIASDEPILSIAPSPDGRWLALAGERHLLLRAPGQVTEPAIEVTLGTTHELAWSADGDFLAALIDDQALAVQMSPAPAIVERHTVGGHVYVAHRGARLHVLAPSGIIALMRSDVPGDAPTRASISGAPVGIALARGQALLAGASDGITVMSDDGDRLLPLAAARVERVVASPRSPYVLAQLEGRLLLWNLDDIQPRRIADGVTGPARFADRDRVVIGGTFDGPAQLIDLTTGATQALGPWPDLAAVSSAGPGRAIAVLDGAHRLHLVAPGRAPEDLAGDIDIAGFATDHQLVTASLTGEVAVLDIRTSRRDRLLVPRSRLLGLAWGRGRHPWIAAALADGTLWRANVATGQTASTPRTPPLDPRHPAAGDGKLLVGDNGSVVFLHDREVHVWRREGGIAKLATAPKPLEELAETGGERLVAIAADTTVYTIERGAVREALASIEASAAAMAPDAGILVAIERGALQILDPQVHQRWTLALPSRVTFADPAIASDGTRVVARTQRGLLVWSIELPASAEATVQWLATMTNAVDDRSPGGLGWR